MDPQEYTDARWHSLLRTAVDLGVDEDDAPALVRRVLAAQRRRIRRAEDPDPLVRAALAEEVRGPLEPRRAPGRAPWRRLLGVVVALGAVLTVIALTRPDELPTDHLDDDQVPSLFGFAGPPAEELLTDLGLDVTVRPTRACEVEDRVVGTDPGPGSTYDRGDPITLFTAVPANITCLTDYQQRVVAWQLLDLAGGRGSGPAFADRVAVSVGGDAPVVLSRDQASRPEGWAGTGVLAALRTAAARVRLTDHRPPTYAVPALRIVHFPEDLRGCGDPAPSAGGTEDLITALVVPPAGTGCPDRLEIHRDDLRRVDAVALYTGSS